MLSAVFHAKSADVLSQADESDTFNESYICFRRREIKAVRKTRASQATSSDKLARLHAELSYPLEMAKAILTRENRKRECAHQAQAVWEKRLAFVDLKRMFPAFVDKADDELLIDKEKPGKKLDASYVKHDNQYLRLILSFISRVNGLKIGVNDLGIPLIRPEISIKPKERLSAISHQIETTLDRQTDIDHHWEDCVDVSKLIVFPFKRNPDLIYLKSGSLPAFTGSLCFKVVQIHTSSEHSVLAL